MQYPKKYNKMENQNNKKIQEMQIIEQSLQNILLQKQSFQMEFSETKNSLEELTNSSDEEVFKIVGQLMIKSDKSKVKKELEEKKRIINLRISHLEKQEESFLEKLEKIREEILGRK